jgi:hypothetical protein
MVFSAVYPSVVTKANTKDRKMLTIGSFSSASWMMDPRVRMLSCAARGTFTDLLASADVSERIGVISINGRPPSMRELARMFQVENPRTIARHIEEIRANGLATIDPSGHILMHIGSHVDDRLTSARASSDRHSTDIVPSFDGHLTVKRRSDDRHSTDIRPANVPDPDFAASHASSERAQPDPEIPNTKPDATVRKSAPKRRTPVSNENNNLHPDPSFRACARAVTVDKYLESSNLESEEERERNDSQPKLSTPESPFTQIQKKTGGAVCGEGGTGGAGISENQDEKRSDVEPFGALIARPDPQKVPRPTRIDPEFSLSRKLREYAVQHGVDPDGEREKFVDHFLQRHDSRARKLDWEAAYRTWVRRAASPPPWLASPSSGRRSGSLRPATGGSAMEEYLAKQRNRPSGGIDDWDFFADDVSAPATPTIDGTIEP